MCPLSAMLTYLESRTPFPTTGPLFTFQSGPFLTRGRLTNETRLLQREGLIQVNLPVTVFVSCSYHSCLSQLTPLAQKVFGRWSSDCFERYIKTSPSVLAKVPQTLTDSCNVCYFYLLRFYYFIVAYQWANALHLWG